MNLILWLALFTALTPSAAGEHIQWKLPPDAGPPVRHAVAVCQRALARRAGAQLPATVILSRQPGRPAESFEIRKSGGTVAIAAPDDVGLMYGVFEMMGQVESAPASASLLESVSPLSRAPATAIRGMCLFPSNREVERDWFYSRDYWNAYFELLARSRFNYFTLVFGDQSSYFGPPFPFMLDVPGYERVSVPTYTSAERKRNLDTLRMVTELADEWGVRFILGIWVENPDKYGAKMVTGLAYRELFDYCPKALELLLRACPKIRGVNLRVNSESGIEEDDQQRFFIPMLKVVQASGRPMWINVRAKGLRDQTVSAARELGARFTVSTKFWREHMGLPYHGLRIDAGDKRRSYRRYGYWDLLPHDRPYDLLYQLWSYGSQKILLWGGLDYARRFTASAHLGDAGGFEIFAPLSHKGYLNRGGDFRIFAAASQEYYRWEFERYWAFYLAFGLAGYAPEGNQPILEGEYRRRFAAAAPALRRAYEEASWIVPYITATRAGSNSNFGYWPEMDSLGLTDHYIRLNTGDDDRFYGVERYVDDYLGAILSAKKTPEAIAARMSRMAGAVTEAMSQAAGDSRELAATRTDFRILSELARYHAARLRSAEAFQFFRKTGERFYLLRAIGQYQAALGHWENVSAAGGIYYDHMVFNRPPDQVGHWKDELPLLKHELERLQEIDRLYLLATEDPAKSRLKAPAATYRLSMQWSEEGGVIKRWPDLNPVPSGNSERYTVQYPAAAIAHVLSELQYSAILHLPIRFAPAGKAAEVHASMLSPRAGARLQLCYRLAGHGFAFTTAEMKRSAENVYTAALPAAAPGKKLFYYLRAESGGTEFLDGSPKEPHPLVYFDTAARGPGISHEEIRDFRVGADLPIEARVSGRFKPAVVRLHYRHLDQSEDWRVAVMLNTGSGRYRAVIPGEFIVPGWDLMYAIETVDETGAGRFYPDLDEREPFVVVKTK